MDQLRERVAMALGAPLVVAGRVRPGRVWPDYAAADKALTALGLDDLDAAVERMAASRAWGADSPMDEETREAFRADLLAALTPPEKP